MTFTNPPIDTSVVSNKNLAGFSSWGDVVATWGDVDAVWGSNASVWAASSSDTSTVTNPTRN